MGFNNLKVNITVRVILMTLTVFLFASLFYEESYTFTKVLVFILIIVQVVVMISFLERGNREVIGFLESIKYDDFSHTYPNKKGNSTMELLYKEFNNVIRKFREIRAEKEAQHQYLKTIVQHVGIGIITFDKMGEIQIMNTAAKRLLNISQIKNISQLKLLNSTLVNTLHDLRTGGRDLIKFSKDGEDYQLAVYAIELSMQGKEFKLISLQNIQSELEEKEMEAWQNLIRVLTHEIMNSVTPISSLAATVESELDNQLNNDLDINQITNEEVEDLYLAVKTIHRRSESLITFVSDFRNMTRITLPKLDQINVKQTLDHVITLLKYDIQEAGVTLEMNIDDELEFCIDQDQIEQVLINLVKNAIQAIAGDDKEERLITIWAKHEGNSILIYIKDTGPGIEEEAQKKIFIPFFTTKKHGSGIGLSLSKQIMRNHKGTINVDSTLGIGTEFSLRFPAMS